MTDDFDITMACLDAIEQEVRRAREALLATRDAEPPARVAWCPDCRVVHSSCRICNEWDHRHVTFDEPLPAGAPIASKTARSDHPSLAHAWEARERHHQEHHQDAHTPREQPQTRSGGTESGDEPFVAASALGDKLRALGVRFQRGVSNSDPANDEDIELNGYAYWATVQGIEALAAEVDRMAQTLDGALTSAAVFKEDRDRLMAIVQDAAQVLDDILGDAQAGMAIEDESETHLRTAQRRGGALDKIGDRILALTDRHPVLALDGAGFKAGGNGEVGV